MTIDTSGAARQPSPLWILALFIALTEVIAGLAAINTDSSVQFLFALFACFFPLVVLGVFFLILWKRPYSFYTPRDYTEQTSVTDFVRAFGGVIKERETVVTTALSQAVGAVLSDANGAGQPDGTELGNAIADQTKVLIAEASILVDTSRLQMLPNRPSEVSIPVSETTPIASVLNQIYFEISDVVAPFKYGEEWVLEDASGDPLPEMGSAWAYRHQMETDSRTLQELGIRPGARLVAMPILVDNDHARGGESQRLEAEISSLKEDLAQTPPAEKGRVMREIRFAQNRLRERR